MTSHSEIECQLATIWRKILGRAVGVTDNFFEVGGTSFLALRLGQEIEQALSRSLPLGILFSLPTIEKLAEYLAFPQESDRAGFSLVPLQTAGTGQPIFVVHWTVGDLVRHLGSARPIYALSFGLAVAHLPEFPGRVEDLAAHYIAEMRRAQPRGPYILVGHSAGGLVAFEMAQQLLLHGETVKFLGLIDTSIPRDFVFEGGRLPLRRQVLNLFRLPPREIYNSLNDQYLGPLTQKLRKQNMNAERFLAYRDFMMSNSEFWLSYVPKPYPGKLTLFRATGILSVRNHRIPPERFWIDLTGGQLEIHDVPGRHLSMIRDPNARALAEKLHACLQ